MRFGICTVVWLRRKPEPGNRNVVHTEPPLAVLLSLRSALKITFYKITLAGVFFQRRIQSQSFAGFVTGEAYVIENRIIEQLSFMLRISKTLFLCFFLSHQPIYVAAEKRSLSGRKTESTKEISDILVRCNVF